MNDVLPALKSVFSAQQIEVLQAWIQNRISSTYIAGSASISAGQVVVSIPTITDDAVVLLFANFSMFGDLTYTIQDGVSLTIISSDGGDVGPINYLVVQP